MITSMTSQLLMWCDVVRLFGCVVRVLRRGRAAGPARADVQHAEKAEAAAARAEADAAVQEAEAARADAIAARVEAEAARRAAEEATTALAATQAALAQVWVNALMCI